MGIAKAKSLENVTLFAGPIATNSRQPRPWYTPTGPHIYRAMSLSPR